MTVESPKINFLKSPYVNQANEVLSQPALLLALDAALLQMAYEMGAAQTTEAAAAKHWQLTGAQMLKTILLAIGTPAKKPSPLTSDNLKHEI